MTPIIAITITVTILFSIYGFQNNNHRFWLNTKSVLQYKNYYRILTSGFVHADWIHLIFNMFTLYAFSNSWSNMYIDYLHYHWSLFLLFYLGGIISGNVVTLLIHQKNNEYNSLGASGGVVAVLFSILLFMPWDKIYIFIIPMPVIVFIILFIGYSIYGGKTKKGNINHWAHLTGAAWGVLITFICYPSIFGFFWRSIIQL